MHAAKKLAYDFGIDPDKPPAAAALRKPKYPQAKGVPERRATLSADTQNGEREGDCLW